MKFRDYIERNQVFTVEQLMSESGMSAASVRTTLDRAIKHGSIERIRRGAYVSKIGDYFGAGVSALDVLAAIDLDAVISFHSALEVHGVAHNVSSMCQFRSRTIKTKFSYGGVLYVPYACDRSIRYQLIGAVGANGAGVTTREQTLVDCLRYTDRAGGVEEALRSLSLFPYLDVDELLALVEQGSASLAARVGWLLEQKQRDWRVLDEQLDRLETMVTGGPYRLDKRQTRSPGWSKRWNLCLPADQEELRSWVL